MENAKLSLAENFGRYFAVNLAVSSTQKAQTYRIRYRVYCDEFKYEPADNFPSEEEQDSYDTNALHCLITHKSSGMPAGCVRMVPVIGEDDDHLLPFEKHCASCIDQVFVSKLSLDRKTVCEISRLAVDGAFRKRSGEAATRFGEIEAMDCTQQEKRAFSLISVAGFLASTAMTDLTGRTNVFAMMEPFLPRLLQRSGIVFQRVGQDIDYHGVRAPYFIRTQDAVDGMRADLRALYDEIYKNIKASYNRVSAEK